MHGTEQLMRDTQCKTIKLPVDVADKAVEAITRLIAQPSGPVSVPAEDAAALHDIGRRIEEAHTDMIF